jgi:hypothetical protein
MIPKDSNLSKENCSHTSSNCVIWEGPDIPCLHLCKGDSVSDVVYKLAEDYCTFKESLNTEHLDISDLLSACGTNTPAPQEKSIIEILRIIIEKIKCLSN